MSRSPSRVRNAKESSLKRSRATSPASTRSAPSTPSASAAMAKGELIDVAEVGQHRDAPPDEPHAQRVLLAVELDGRGAGELARGHVADFGRQHVAGPQGRDLPVRGADLGRGDVV